MSCAGECNQWGIPLWDCMYINYIYTMNLLARDSTFYVFRIKQKKLGKSYELNYSLQRIIETGQPWSTNTSVGQSNNLHLDSFQLLSLKYLSIFLLTISLVGFEQTN